MDYIEMFAGEGGFRYGFEACNRQQQKDSEIGGCGSSVSPQGEQPNQASLGRDNIGDMPQPEEGESEEGRNRIVGIQGTRLHGGFNPSFSCIWANEWDRWAAAIYRYHYGEVLEADIKTINATTIPNHDLITAGFPCQSFSIAGARGGLADIRGTLFQEICRVARIKESPYLLLENVKGLLSAPYTETIQTWDEEDFNENGEPTPVAQRKHKGIPGTKGWVFLTILNSLREIGYDCQWEVLNSRYCGVPQNRERVFIIGHLRGQTRPKVFPIGEDGQIFNGEGKARERRTQTQHSTALRGSNIKADTTFIMHNIYGGFKETEPRIFEDISPAIRTPKGGGHLPVVASAVLTPDREKIRQYGRRKKNPDEPMFTLTGQDIHGVQIANALDANGYLRTGARPRDKNGKPQLLPIGYRRYRRLTPIECERLQGFPDNWSAKGIDSKGNEIDISDSQRYKVNGNAVTTTVIEAIGRQLIAGLHGD